MSITSRRTSRKTIGDRLDPDTRIYLSFNWLVFRSRWLCGVRLMRPFGRGPSGLPSINPCILSVRRCFRKVLPMCLRVIFHQSALPIKVIRLILLAPALMMRCCAIPTNAVSLMTLSMPGKGKKYESLCMWRKSDDSNGLRCGQVVSWHDRWQSSFSTGTGGEIQ